MNELVKTALSNITEGLCRPLRLRLEQIISADIGPSVLHTVVGLIRFYLNTVGLVSNLSSKQSEIFDQFTNSIRF